MALNDTDLHVYLTFLQLSIIFKVEGLVLDHGSRHPNMKRRADNWLLGVCDNQSSNT